MKTLNLALSIFWMLIAAVEASPAPPFGSSITWNTGKETPSLEAMRGKAILVVFFQSWCPLCNEWSGKMFQNITATYKDDPRVVLVALKTDGGSVRDALGYLKGRGAEMDRWLVGTDANATFARQATGVDSLYTYAWITPEGSIGESGKAGSVVTNSNPKVYWAARTAAMKKFVESAKPLFESQASMPEALRPVALRAEQGLLATALAESQRLASRAELTEAVAKLRSTIAARVQASVAEHTAILSSSENPDRYLSYLALLEIESRFANSPFAQAAKIESAQHSSAPWVAKEREAERAYEALMRKASRADDERAITRMTKSLQEFGALHKDTVFGRLAANATDSEK
jgi:hypothetical protein